MDFDGLELPDSNSMAELEVARCVAGPAAAVVGGPGPRLQEFAVKGIAVLFIEVVENGLLGVYRDEDCLKHFLLHWIIKLEIVTFLLRWLISDRLWSILALVYC